MPVMLLPFFPMATVLMGSICIIASDILYPKFEWVGLMEDTADCDDECGFACCCCHDPPIDDNDILYDDSTDSFYAYAKKS